jgi:hypothetical protein
MCAHSDYTVDNRATVQGLLKSKPYSTYKELREKEPKESFFLYDSCDPNVPAVLSQRFSLFVSGSCSQPTSK